MRKSSLGAVSLGDGMEVGVSGGYVYQHVDVVEELVVVVLVFELVWLDEARVLCSFNRKAFNGGVAIGVEIFIARVGGRPNGDVDTYFPVVFGVEVACADVGGGQGAK